MDVLRMTDWAQRNTHRKSWTWVLSGLNLGLSAYVMPEQREWWGGTALSGDLLSSSSCVKERPGTHRKRGGLSTHNHFSSCYQLAWIASLGGVR